MRSPRTLVAIEGGDAAGSQPLEREGLDLSKPAVVCAGRVRTYRELRDASRRVAAGLVGLGVEVSDRVAVLSGNRLELLEIELGIAGAGAIMVALDRRLRRDELRERLLRTGARAILLEDRFLGAVLELRSAGALSELRTVVTLEAGPADLSYEELFASARAELPLASRPPESPRKIRFFPRDRSPCRAVVWTEGAVARNARRQALDHGLGREHSTYAAIDLSGIGGRHDLTWAALAQGGTAHVASSPAIGPGEVYAYVAAHGITHLGWGPGPRRGVAALPHAGQHDVDPLRTILCEWHALPDAAVLRARERFPRLEVVQVYGLDDGGPAVAALRSADVSSKPGSAGRLSDGVELRVVDPGGELHVRGPALAALSWEAGGPVDRGLEGGWVATGDRGHVDGEGFVFLQDRRRDWRIG